MNVFSWNKYTQGKIILSDDTDFQIKCPVLGVDQKCHRLPLNNIICYMAILVIYQKLTVRPYCWWYQTLWSQKYGQLKLTLVRKHLLSWYSFHNTSKCYEVCLERKFINIFSQLWTPWVTIMIFAAGYACACNCGTIVMGVTTCFVIRLKIHHATGKTCLVLKNWPRTHYWEDNRSQE